MFGKMILKRKGMARKLLLPLFAASLVATAINAAPASALPQVTSAASTAASVTSSVQSTQQSVAGPTATSALVGQAASQLHAVLNSATMVTAQVTLSSATSGICSITKGVGGIIYYDWVGMYMCAGIAVLCPDPLKNTAAPARWVDTTTVYYPTTGTQTTTSKLTLVEVATLNTLLDKFATPLNVGGALNGKTSAVVNGVRYSIADYGRALRLAGWKYAHQTSRLNRDLPVASAAVKALYTYMVNYAASNAGNYTLTKVSQKNPDLNGTGNAVYKVTSVTTKKPIKGVSLKATVTTGNATASSTVSDANGLVTVSFKRTNKNNIHVTVSGNGPSNKVRSYVPQLTIWQRFFSAAPRLPFSAAFDSNVSPKPVSLDYNCKGCLAAPVKSTAPVCNTFNGAETRVYLEDNGVVRGDYVAVGSTCVTPTWRVTDGHKVRVRLSVNVNGVWIHYYFGFITVDCRPAPKLVFESESDCTARVINISVPASPDHAIALVINGEMITAPAGQPISYHKAAPCTQALDYTLQSGITSHNGVSWNMSAAEAHTFAAQVN